MMPVDGNTIMALVVLIGCLPQWVIRSWWNSHIKSWMSSGHGQSWHSSRKLNIMFIWTEEKKTEESLKQQQSVYLSRSPSLIISLRVH